MVDKMIPSEMEFTRRIISCITQYFRNKGYQIYAEVVDHTKIESSEGTDAVLIIGNKLWGFQTKRPSESRMERYKLDEEQHELIQERDWIHYAFPENLPRKDMKNILYRTKFCDGIKPYQHSVNIDDIKECKSWGEIAKGIEDCPIGKVITDEKDREKLHKELITIIEDAIVILDFNRTDNELRVLVGYEEQVDWRSFPKRKEKKNNMGKKCPRCGYPD